MLSSRLIQIVWCWGFCKICFGLGEGILECFYLLRYGQGWFRVGVRFRVVFQDRTEIAVKID